MNEHYGHTLDGLGDKSQWQKLEDHLWQTAALTRQFATALCAADWGYLAGLWHDLGKYSQAFQSRLCSTESADAHIEQPGKVDHSTAGAQHAVRRFGTVGKILAYVIAGHHGGLPDGNSPESCLRLRLQKEIPDYSASPPNILAQPLPAPPFKPSVDRAGIQLSMFTRMLFSCLVDADFLDTEAFVDDDKSRQRGRFQTLDALEPLFAQRLADLRNAVNPSPVNDQRAAVLRQCLAASQRDMGFFSLTVPTGGGKTLSSMAFALKHAQLHRLRRIIYVIPFTSIIEQNADVFRRVLGDEAVLEHHSNFEPEQEDHRSRLAAENWDAPIVVTTNVQFFESLFASRSSRCRKLHNIAESVVILDEVQSLPAEYLLPCLEVLKELRDHYRTSIVLCSATQPAVQKRDDFIRGLQHVTEIVADPVRLARDMRRVEITVVGQLSDEEIVRRLTEQSQVLCVVNTREHARNLHMGLHNANAEGVFHLSALMCAAHRSEVLSKIRSTLTSRARCRVVSTQLVEAGVDIDFPVVYRALAGIDSIAQAAGRCNREGKLETIGQVNVFTPENGLPPGQLRQTAQIAESTIRRFSDDILSLAAIEDYFRNYYWIKGTDGLDADGILASLQEGIVRA